MAKSQISETQFVFGYLSELYLRQFRHPHMFPFWAYFMFPSTLIEREFPVDFFADFYTHSEYYQFKRSEHLQQRRGSREIAEGVPSWYLDYYRFKIYNRTSATTLGQFEKLIQLSTRFPSDLVCYCAPCFHTETEFHFHFQNRSIVRNSIIIDCQQFGHANFQPPNFDINDGLDHYLVFKQGTTTGYLCSEPKEIKIMNAKSRAEGYKKQEGQSLLSAVSVLYNEFYLKDDLKTNIEKVITENVNEQFAIVGKYLLQFYNILWQPKFREI